MLAHRSVRISSLEVLARMPDAPRPVPGRAAISRTALLEIVHDAVLGSYGVTRLTEPSLLWRIRSALHLGSGAIRMALKPAVRVDVWVTVAYGLPVAEVARQIDSAVRYGLQRAIGREVGPIAVHVEGMAGRPFISSPAAANVVDTPAPVPTDPAGDGAA